VKLIFENWRRFLDEGGGKSSKTGELDPALALETIKVYLRFLEEWNRWLVSNGESPVTPVEPKGSVSYVEQDFEEGTEDVVYGDIDYLVEFPLAPTEAESHTERKKEQNDAKNRYRNLIVEFMRSSSVPPEVDVETTLSPKPGTNKPASPFMVVLEVHPEQFVQVDTVITFPGYTPWMKYRYEPERGLKGYTMGYLYRSFGDLFPLSLSTEGVLARIRGGELVSSKFRKNVEIEFISKDPAVFLLDIVRYILKREVGKEDIQIHPILEKHPGLTKPVTIAQLATGIKGAILTLAMNGYRTAPEMLQQVMADYKHFVENYYTKLEKKVQNWLVAVPEGPKREAYERKLKKTFESTHKALEIVQSIWGPGGV